VRDYANPVLAPLFSKNHQINTFEPRNFVFDGFWKPRLILDNILLGTIASHLQVSDSLETSPSLNEVALDLLAFFCLFSGADRQRSL
jgi:hypothetical protein